MKQPLVSVIVANYNGKQYLEDCFKSIFQQDYNGNIEIIFIDDNSNDGSYEFVEMNFPEVIAVKNSINYGHSASCNEGIKISQGDYLFLIDNDTVFEANCIRELVSYLDKYMNIGCVGGLIKDYGDSNIIQDMGMDMDILGYGYSKEGSINGFKINDENQYSNTIKHCFYISSCALMITRKVIDDIGMFDKAYFMYKDDLDLCWRCLLAGYDIAVNPRAKIFHKMGVTLGGTYIQKKVTKYETSSAKRYFGERNTIRTLIKNYELKSLIWVMPIYFTLNLMEIVIFSITLNFDVVKAYILAWIWNIIHIKDTLNERQQIKKIRKRSDGQIMRHMYKGSAKLKIFLQIGLPEFK